MFFKLDFEAETPIYEQLKQQILIAMAKKELQPGDRLPSVRTLASDIGVNLHTVNKAYQQLKQEGYLLIHRQRGVVVHPEPPQIDEDYQQQLLATLRPLIASAICRGMKVEQFTSLCTTIFTEFEEGD